MKCCQHHLKICFRKRKVHCHNTRYATNQNYFIQQVSTNAGKKTISNRGATHWANVDQQLKDKSHSF